MLKVTVKNTQAAKDAIQQALKKLMTDKAVTVGIHADAGNVESDDLTMAGLGAIHEFGAEINHPGGTPYADISEGTAENPVIRFVKPNSGYKIIGYTQPHKINIPARPWLAPGVASGNEVYVKIIERELADGGTAESALEKVGVAAVGKVQKYMTDLKNPPNAPSTIRKKGSSNPLIDSGALRSSVTYKVTSETMTEGL